MGQSRGEPRKRPPIKILDIAQFVSPLSGGVKRYLDEKSRHVEARGGIEHVLLVPGEEDRTTIRHGTRVVEVASPRLPGSVSYRLFVRLRRLRALAEAEAPDLIEVGDPYQSAAIGRSVGCRLGVPVVGFYHSDFPHSLGRTVRRFAGPWAQRAVSAVVDPWVVGVYGRMDLTVTPSPVLEETLRGLGVGRVATVPLGVDVERFRPRPAEAARVRRELGLPETRDGGPTLLLYAGRLAREKNVRSLLTMMEILARRSPGALRLLLVGDGEERGRVEAAAERRRDVTWHPYCRSAARLGAFYTAADLLVHAGTSETFGLVSIEAQACGTPVVAVAGGGLDSTLAPEAVRARSAAPEDLATAVLEARRRSGVGLARVAEGRLRRDRIVERFHAEATFDALFGLYGRLLAERVGVASVDGAAGVGELGQ